MCYLQYVTHILQLHNSLLTVNSGCHLQIKLPLPNLPSHFTFVANIFSHGLSTSPFLLMYSSWNKMRRELCLACSSLGWYHDSQVLIYVHYYNQKLFSMKYNPPITVCHKLTEIIRALFRHDSMFLSGNSSGWSILARKMQLNDRTQKSLQFHFNSGIIWFLQIISVKDFYKMWMMYLMEHFRLCFVLCYGTAFRDYGWYGGGGVVSVPVLFSNNGSSACSELPASAKVELFSSEKYYIPDL